MVKWRKTTHTIAKAKKKKKSYKTLEKTNLNFFRKVINDLSGKGAARIFLQGFDIQVYIYMQFLV